MRRIITYLLILFCLKTIGQEEKILSFNLLKGTVDTLDLGDFDTSIVEEHTNYFIGNIDNNIAFLNEEVPTENIYPGSNFTRKRQASTAYDINDFPIRTTVKLYKWENNSLKSKCTGSIISRKHVLTAGHCVAHLNKDSLLYDSLFVSPVYDNGKISPIFQGSWVKKIYLFKNWNLGKDFSILELENPIGDYTGWISIGFDSNDINLLDGIFYKFSYPATTMPEIDPNPYNGDTLYYGYGLADLADKNGIMIQGTSGIPGESGSSLIKINNEHTYTSYGVLSFSTDLYHNRLTNWKYFALKQVIKDDISLNVPDLELYENIRVYPNPAKNIVNVHMADESTISTISIINSQGQIIKVQSNKSSEATLDISVLPVGFYLLKIESGNKVTVRKMVKNGSS